MSEFTVNLETQEVLVKGTLPYDDVLARIKKTGKEVWIDLSFHDRSLFTFNIRSDLESRLNEFLLSANTGGNKPLFKLNTTYYS